MPGKKPQIALDNYLIPLRKSLACVTDCFFRYTSARPNIEQTLTLAEPLARLTSASDEQFGLSFVHEFKIQRSGKGWKVTTLSYRYGFEDGDNNELVLYHWHPASRVREPHMHVPCAGAIREELHKAHFPTRRMSFEDFLLCLITEFRITAVQNYEAILIRNREAFRNNSSWV